MILPPKSSEEGDGEGGGAAVEGDGEPRISPVIVEARINETKCDVSVALRSVRPYHYPAGQEGDLKPSYLGWTLTSLSGGDGILLSRDRTVEDRETMTRNAWEEKEEGRKERAASKRTRYQDLMKKKEKELKAREEKNAQEQEAKKRGISYEEYVALQAKEAQEAQEAAAAVAAEAAAAAEAAGEETTAATPESEQEAATTEETFIIHDGLNGLDEEERRVAEERREKMVALPPITLTGHVVLGAEIAPLSARLQRAGGKSPRGGKKKKVKTHYVAKPSKYLDGVISTANDAGMEGMSIRSSMRTELQVERGRRALAKERQVQTLRGLRAKNLQKLQSLSDRRQALLFPKEEEEEKEEE